MTANGLAGTFSKVSYVVRDLDATARWFNQALGVEFGEVASGPLAAGGSRFALASAGGRGELEIELIQPDSGNNVLSQFVEGTGGGLHHIGFEGDDFESAIESFQREGITRHTASADGSTVAWFDCGCAGASIIEVAHYDPAVRRQRQRMKAASTLPSDPQAPRLVQVSYTVDDLDAVTGWFQRVVGVSHLGVTKATAGRDYQVLVRDQPVSTPFSLRTAMGRLGPRGEQEIEIIQPVDGPSPYRDFLQRHGAGLNHVSFLVKDFEPAAQRMRKSGASALIEFRGHGIRACYFDCRAAGASIVEIGYFDEKAAAALERVKTPRELRT